ncbi:molybdenum cofactor synthesis 2 [Ganoderma leucocontextum]|nr:molybdenum cofactor synthesis 2 [Ganoderma leucocontextum]
MHSSIPDIPAASIEARLEILEGICVLTYEKLDTQTILQSVSDDGAGATAVFIGTTRNSFKGRVVTSSVIRLVTRLDYQAYSKLAIRTMADILRNTYSAYTRSEHQTASDGSMQAHSLIRTAVHHRLGTVPVGEPSIVIAVSSPHRKEAFAACEGVLEEVKLKAQIWKREFYEGEREEDALWKANVDH